MDASRKQGARAPVVIGTQMAAAIDAEKRHQSVPQDPSPIGGLRYELTRGDLDLFRSVDSRIDELIGSVVDDTYVAELAQLDEKRASLTQDDLYTLLTFCRRQALTALRQVSSRPIISGFRALSLIDLSRIDWRDAAVAAGLLSYAGQRVGAPIRELVGDTTRRSQPAMADVVARHSAESERGLTVGGFREVETSWGVGLAQDYGHPYAPTVDLLSIAEAVVTLIERDKYRVDHITTGADLPGVWLPAAEEAATCARETLRACVSVAAHPKEGKAGRFEQMFSVWIAEAAKSSDASAIAAAAVPKIGSDIAILSVASERLCAVLVARSVVKGKRPLEDMKSLERFRSALEDAVSAAIG